MQQQVGFVADELVYRAISSTVTGAKYSTTTEYVFNGDALLATVDRQLAAGTATGTAKTRYVHPDHLGSTNVVTDENGNLVQTLDYYPYGATRTSVATSTNEKRKFIGQFTDDSGLDYFNARFYNSSQGQFISEDPTFLGDPMQQGLLNPQNLNSYSYAIDNPIAARGRVDDEPALVDALARRQIRGAALDVTVEEPLPADSPLWGHGARALHATYRRRDLPPRRQCARDHAGESRAALARRDRAAEPGGLDDRHCERPVSKAAGKKEVDECGTRSSSTIMVIRMASTPSLNAARRSFPILAYRARLVSNHRT
jgi:RHS repeat-associated protein